MKKIIKINLALMLLIITTSFIKYENNAQTAEFPPIQKYLDNIKGEKFVTVGVIEKDKMISQIITKDSFTSINKDKNDKLSKYVYSNINWKSFYKANIYSVRETEKIVICRLKFDETFTVKLYSNDEIYYTGETNDFDCYIYARDEKSVLKIIEDWNKKSK
ncbi:hypothetical protein [Halpernia sp.]|uniref:hypothetical protein n=1 Tax=Halpernia sp. TaxID=2782209 RepID=UPI003A9434E4